MCRPKHVKQLRNTGIINSTTRLHLVGFCFLIDLLEFSFVVCAHLYVKCGKDQTDPKKKKPVRNVSEHMGGWKMS